MSIYLIYLWRELEWNLTIEADAPVEAIKAARKEVEATPGTMVDEVVRVIEEAR